AAELRQPETLAVDADDLVELFRVSREPNLHRRESFTARPARATFLDGAGGARTRGLSDAIRTLSQLSYGPSGAQFSREFEVPRPVDPQLLIVLGRREAKQDLRSSGARVKRDEVTAVNVGTIGSVGIDFISTIGAPENPMTIPTTRIAPEDDDIPVPRGPLALDSHQLIAKIEDEVVSLAVCNRSVDTDTQLHRGADDFSFCDRALLIRGEHVGSLANASAGPWPFRTSSRGVTLPT